MKKNNFKTIGEYFLYVVLCICIFTFNVLIGMFVAGNTDVFEWSTSGIMGIVIASLVMCFYMFLSKNCYSKNILPN